jgi:hypothetical protein
MKIQVNWHVVGILVGALGAAVTSLESSDPKHVQYYLTALFVLHAIQSALGLDASRKIEKLSGSSGPPAAPPSPPASKAVQAAAATFCLFLLGAIAAGGGVTSAPEMQVGCGSNPGIQPLIQDTEKLGICVVQAAASDLPEAFSDPDSMLEAIASSCSAYGMATAAQILATVEEAIANSPATQVPPSSPDAGTSSLVLARLKRVRDAAAHAVARSNVARFGSSPK